MVITVERDPDPVDMVLDSKDKRDDETDCWKNQVKVKLEE